MSQLKQLKATMDTISQGTKQTASSLAQFKQKFSQQVGQVQAAIAGSTQRKDQEIVSALEEAQRKVDEAGRSLENASKVAAAFGQSL